MGYADNSHTPSNLQPAIMLTYAASQLLDSGDCCFFPPVGHSGSRFSRVRDRPWPLSSLLVQRQTGHVNLIAQSHPGPIGFAFEPFANIVQIAAPERIRERTDFQVDTPPAAGAGPSIKACT